MRKLLFMVAIGIGIVALLRRVLPAEQRARLRENISSVPGAMMEMMPEGSPPKVMMSTVRRLEEQSDEVARLLRAQNKLLRKQNDILKAAVPAAQSTG